MIRNCVFALVIAFVCSSLSATALAQDANITAEDFTTTHVGKCILYKGESEGSQCFTAEGATNYDDKTYGKDTGKWKFEDGKLCVSYTKEPAWSCAAWKRNGDNVYTDGSYTWSVQ